jgi:prolyl oligopeptidase
MKNLHLFALISAAAYASAVAASTTKHPASDPYIWLEDARGERAMSWVKSENAKTLKVLEAESRFAGLFEDAKHIAEAKDRTPDPNQLAGQIYNLWQDAEHPHGLWRRTSVADYQSESTAWQTVIDLDALSAQEHANWFWGGLTCLEPKETRCLVALSDGGEDAVTVREFDFAKPGAVVNGFSLPSGKQQVVWEDTDTVLVAREWTKGDLSQAGYPLIVKRLKRGLPLESATEVYHGTRADFAATLLSLDDGAGNHALLVERGVDFFRFERFLVQGSETLRLDLPLKSNVIGLVDGQIVVQVNEPWQSGGSTLPTGSLISVALDEARSHPQTLHPQAIYTPLEREALVSAATSQQQVLVHFLDNVNGRMASYRHGKAGWERRALPGADNASLQIVSTDLHSEQAFINSTGFLSPSQLQLLDLSSGSIKPVKTLPARFDASRHVVEQFAATSTDGTQIPYFIVHPKDAKLDGRTPIIIGAYGGFQVPVTPHYDSMLGKLWLERGGAFVLANIRGGGEFGPKWHEAGLKTNRQRIFDDFAAVGRDVVARGYADVPHLGIRGGSNGGLLMGVEFTQHPDMWSAVDIQVPLLDMLRFEQIAAGSSWVGEYGSVKNPQERKFLASISPYHNIKSNVHYPEALIWTTTKDDRVGPQHARKFAAKLAEMKVPYLFYEVIEGGHGSGATPAEHAHTVALEYTYFWKKLAPQ